MQLLAMITSFIFGRMNKQTHSLRTSALEIFEEAIGKSRKVVVLTLVGLAAVTFFCGGVFISILNMTAQYDINGFVSFTSTLGAGLALLVLALAGFTFVFARAWPGANKKIEVRQEIHHSPSSLEQALSVLVMDFVKEREQRRQHEAGFRPSSAATSGATNSASPKSAAKGTPKSNDTASSNPIH